MGDRAEVPGRRPPVPGDLRPEQGPGPAGRLPAHHRQPDPARLGAAHAPGRPRPWPRGHPRGGQPARGGQRRRDRAGASAGAAPGGTAGPGNTGGRANAGGERTRARRAARPGRGNGRRTGIAPAPGIAPPPPSGPAPRITPREPPATAPARTPALASTPTLASTPAPATTPALASMPAPASTPAREEQGQPGKTGRSRPLTDANGSAAGGAPAPRGPQLPGRTGRSRAPRHRDPGRPGPPAPRATVAARLWPPGGRPGRTGGAGRIRAAGRSARAVRPGCWTSGCATFPARWRWRGGPARRGRRSPGPQNLDLGWRPRCYLDAPVPWTAVGDGEVWRLHSPRWGRSTLKSATPRPCSPAWSTWAPTTPGGFW